MATYKQERSILYEDFIADVSNLKGLVTLVRQ